MAKFTSLNQLPATGAEAVYMMKQCLVAAGWTVPSSSDGTTYNSSGDQITDGTKLDNVNAWFIVRDPGGRREFCFQRIATNLSWRIKFSESAKFTGGSPGATRVPSATDEGIPIGAGTDASPSGGPFLQADGTYYCHTLAYSDTVAGDVYSFFFFLSAKVTGVCGTRLLVDGFTNYPAADVSPLGIILVNTTGQIAGNGLLTAASAYLFAWYKYGLSGASFLTWRFGMPNYSAGVSAPPYAPYNASVGIGPSPIDGAEPVLRVVTVVRCNTDTSPCVKGIFSRIAWCVTYDRSYPWTVGLYSADPWCHLGGDWLIPWETGTAPKV